MEDFLLAAFGLWVISLLVRAIAPEFRRGALRSWWKRRRHERNMGRLFEAMPDLPTGIYVADTRTGKWEHVGTAIGPVTFGPAPEPKPRITWVDELRDPVRPASQRGGR